MVPEKWGLCNANCPTSGAGSSAGSGTGAGSGSGECETVSNDPGRPCIFPFTFGDSTHVACTADLDGSAQCKDWCATEVYMSF